MTKLMAFIAPVAPPERTAVLRILVSAFVVGYVAIRWQVFAGLSDNPPDRFRPVGVARVLDDPVDGFVVELLLIATVLFGIASILGYRYRATGPLFALATLTLLTYRSSWGQILWFEILMVLHLLIVGLSPAADSLSLDRRRFGLLPNPDPTYGWPVRLAAFVTVTTYVVAGVAKLRIGGVEWVFGDALRNHVAFSAARLDVLGGTSSPVAEAFVSVPPIGPALAGGALLLELGAPIALLGARARLVWTAGTWLMHAVIAVTMFVVFPYPLFLVAMAPLFELEALHRRIADRMVG